MNDLIKLLTKENLIYDISLNDYALFMVEFLLFDLKKSNI